MAQSIINDITWDRYWTVWAMVKNIKCWPALVSNIALNEILQPNWKESWEDFPQLVEFIPLWTVLRHPCQRRLIYGNTKITFWKANILLLEWTRLYQIVDMFSKQFPREDTCWPSVQGVHPRLQIIQVANSALPLIYEIYFSGSNYKNFLQSAVYYSASFYLLGCD